MERIFFCNHCTESYSDERILQIHKSRAHKELYLVEKRGKQEQKKPHKCCYCDYRSKSLQGLKIHKTHNHKDILKEKQFLLDQVNEFSCHLCAKSYNSLTSFYLHLALGHKIKTSDYILEKQYNNIIPVCGCGCGEQMKYYPTLRDYGKWKQGHKTKVVNFGNEQGYKSSKETRKKLSEQGLLKNSEETKKKKSLARMGNKNPIFGKHHSQETKNKIGNLAKERNLDPLFKAKMDKYFADPEVRKGFSTRRSTWMANNPFKFKPSKLETLLSKYLDEWSIKYERQQSIGNKVFDFQIKNTNIIIEVDGDFWHCNPKLWPEGPAFQCQADAVLNDRVKDLILKEKGFRLIRLWESDIKKNIEEVKQKILKEINDTN
jgi:very-short-patch-repair endonuclease